MNSNLIKALEKCIIDGDQNCAVQLVQKLIELKTPSEIIVTDCIEKAMEQIDSKCTLEQFNLLEIMLSGRAVMAVMKLLYPEGGSSRSTKGKVVVASLEGDVHDLGKNIFKMVLEAKGYQVIDCGKDCPVEVVVETASNENAVCVGISGLITSTIPNVKRVKQLLHDKGVKNILVIAGGAALKQSTPEKLNVDYIAQNTFDGLHFLQKNLRVKK